MSMDINVYFNNSTTLSKYGIIEIFQAMWVNIVMSSFTTKKYM